MKAKILLKQFGACEESIEWVGDMTIIDAWNTCDRGGWLLWFYHKTYPLNTRELTLAKAYCANTVRHLLKDKRSIDAIDAAIAYGHGKIDEFILRSACLGAYDAAYGTKNESVTVAAAASAANASDITADPLYCAGYANIAAMGANISMTQNQITQSDICRRYLTIS